MDDKEQPLNLDDITFPLAPWHLKGRMFQSISLIDIKAARQFVPKNMKILTVSPGKTVGGVCLASYMSSSTLIYNELAIICAFTMYANKIGAWISHIYVDNLSSLKSGPEMWGLPKELGRFAWDGNEGDAMSVMQGGNDLCSVICSKPMIHLNFPVLVPTFGSVGGDIRWFRGKGKMDLGLARAKINIPRNSPFSCLNLDNHLIAIVADQVDMTYDNIQVIG